MTLSRFIIYLFTLLLLAIVLIAICSVNLDRLRSYPKDWATDHQIKIFERLLSVFNYCAVITGALAGVLIVILLFN